LIASDGADGLMQVAEHRTDLRVIITDLHMPFMDGLSFVRALRRLLPNIPVVIASGRLEERAMEDFKTLGVTQFLDKPFTEGQLVDVLKNILSPTAQHTPIL
jgi:CheY-like chemotaxis protein